MKKKVLVAEDDKAILEVVKIILQDGGYDVMGVETGEGITTLIAKEQPHLVLLDIWLAGHDGGTIARNLRQANETKTIPIIMVSANNETEKIAKEVGANDFLQKPFNIDELLAMVERHSR